MKLLCAAVLLCLLAGTFADKIAIRRTSMLAHQDGHSLSLMTFDAWGVPSGDINFHHIEKAEYLATTFWNKFYVLAQDFSTAEVSALVMSIDYTKDHAISPEVNLQTMPFDRYTAISYDATGQLIAIGWNSTTNNGTVVSIDTITGEVRGQFPLLNNTATPIDYFTTDLITGLVSYSVHQSNGYHNVICSVNVATLAEKCLDFQAMGFNVLAYLAKPANGSLWMIAFFSAHPTAVGAVYEVNPWTGYYKMFSFFPPAYNPSNSSAFLMYYDALYEKLFTVWRQGNTDTILATDLDDGEFAAEQLIRLPPGTKFLAMANQIAPFEIPPQNLPNEPPSFVEAPADHNGAAIAFGILVPLIVIGGAVAGFFLYRKYRGGYVSLN